MEFGDISSKLVTPRANLARSRPVIVVPFSTLITLDCQLGNKFKVTLTASGSTIKFINTLDDNYILHLVQGAGGSFTTTWDAAILWSLSTTPILSTTAGLRDLFSFTIDTAADGTRVALGSFLKGYAK